MRGSCFTEQNSSHLQPLCRLYIAETLYRNVSWHGWRLTGIITRIYCTQGDETMTAAVFSAIVLVAVANN